MLRRPRKRRSVVASFSSTGDLEIGRSEYVARQCVFPFWLKCFL